MNKKILHLTNDFSGSTVYKNLCEALDTLNFSQIIYTPIRLNNQIDKNKIEFIVKDSRILYRKVLSFYTRINYRGKINRVVSDVLTTLDINEFKLIHAHTWFSDGGAAYELHKKYNIPYVITIRNTDLNIFFKYMYHLRSYGLEILLNASKIIFISPIYKERLLGHSYMTKHVEKLTSKSEMVVNGIDPFWLKNIASRKQSISKPIKILYIGKFSKGKNVAALICAIELIRTRGIDCILNLVGGDGSEFNKIMKFCQNKSWIFYWGKIFQKDSLMEIYRQNHIFAMPSKNETFGLVYIEALTQGIPVVYTKNEGIDGLYRNIGESVDARDINNISSGIENIINNYIDYDFDPNKIAEKHDWKMVADKLQVIYNQMN